MNTGKLLVGAAVALGAVLSAGAQSENYLGSTAGSWTAYSGGVLPTLNTTAPGSITGAAAGWRYARTTSAAGTVPGTWRVGDTYTMNFTGTIGNGTILRVEFSDPNHLDGLQMYMQNLATAGGDKVSIWSMGTAAATTLYTGDFGGSAGVGLAEQITANLVFTVLAGAKTASVSGTLGDNRGDLPVTGLTIPLGTTTSSLYAAFNLSSAGAISGISSLEWSYQAVPEPQTWTLFASFGLVALGFGRRSLSRKS